MAKLFVERNARHSLLPAPCSPLPAPCSLLPAPRSLLPAPCFPLPASRLCFSCPLFATLVPDAAREMNMRKTAEFHRIHAEGRAHQLRRRIALEAARLISEQGIRDYRVAKRKAAQRVGINDEGYLPRNREIEDALREHQRLFRTEEQPRAQQFRLETARDAMRFLA